MSYFANLRPGDTVIVVRTEGPEFGGRILCPTAEPRPGIVESCGNGRIHVRIKSEIVRAGLLFEFDSGDGVRVGIPSIRIEVPHGSRE